MSTTYPIKNEEKLRKFKEYYLLKKPVHRNYAMIIMGLNTAFRISDLLKLQWNDVYNKKKNCFKDHICITEQKTGKQRSVAINKSVFEALQVLQKKRLIAKRTRIFSRTADSPQPLYPVPRLSVLLRKPPSTPGWTSI